MITQKLNNLINRINTMKPVSAVALLTLFIFLLGFGLRFVRHNELNQLVRGSDPEGYYQYLPAFFIDNDVHKQGWTTDIGNGKKINKFTSGVAIMQMPFFLIAHALSFVTPYESSGWSSIYFLFIMIGASFYTAMALRILYVLIRKRYGFKPALIAASLLFLSTNLYYYSVREMAMSHIYSFFLFTCFLYMLPLFFNKPNVKKTILVALPLSIAVLIRPTSIVLIFFFLLYNVYSFSDIKNRILFFIQRFHLVLLIGVTSLFVFLPQMLYWNEITGQYVFYSYTDEGFPFWNNPQFFTVLFGHQNGWLLYAPIMILGIIGIYPSLKNKQNSVWAVIVTLLLILYINASWWVPTFSAAYGYWAMLEYQVFLAFPIALMVHKIIESRNMMLKISSAVLAVLLCIINIRNSYIYEAWYWWDNELTWSIYLRSFF